MKDINPPGAVWSNVMSISADGIAAGSARLADGSTFGFLYNVQTGQSVDVNTLIYPCPDLRWTA